MLCIHTLTFTLTTKVNTHSLRAFSTSRFEGRLRPSNTRIGLTLKDNSMSTNFIQYHTYLGMDKLKMPISVLDIQLSLQEEDYKVNIKAANSDERALAPSCVSGRAMRAWSRGWSECGARHNFSSPMSLRLYCDPFILWELKYGACKMAKFAHSVQNS